MTKHHAKKTPWEAELSFMYLKFVRPKSEERAIGTHRKESQMDLRADRIPIPWSPSSG
jgi:hypothetical protein